MTRLYAMDTPMGWKGTESLDPEGLYRVDFGPTLGVKVLKGKFLTQQSKVLGTLGPAGGRSFLSLSLLPGILPSSWDTLGSSLVTDLGGGWYEIVVTNVGGVRVYFPEGSFKGGTIYNLTFLIEEATGVLGDWMDGTPTPVKEGPNAFFVSRPEYSGLPYFDLIRQTAGVFRGANVVAREVKK